MDIYVLVILGIGCLLNLIFTIMALAEGEGRVSLFFFCTTAMIIAIVFQAIQRASPG